MLASLGTAHTAYNLRRLPRPPAEPAPLAERVSVLLPLRDEEHRARPCLEALREVVRADPRVEVLVLDDGSSDGTAALAAEVLGPVGRVVSGRPLPAGWLGKPWACAQLAELADPASSALVFVDADVVLAPHAVRATVQLLRERGLALVSPYPRQLCASPAERLVQPLLQWSWATTLPLGLAERSTRPSLAAANGQLLCVDRAAYDRCGGHAGVRREVLEDLALLRAVKRSGGRGGVADGTTLATCRMYTGWGELREGYTKSLWAAFGSPAGTAAVTGALALAYVVPPAAALRGSRAGLAGYAAAVAGRVLVARRTGGRQLDALAHPASVAVFSWLAVRSWLGRRAGTLAWKGRPLG
ncbi:glycosyltransferase [Motilibacter peucedani]